MTARDGQAEIVFLSGFMGAGKSTVGAGLAALMSVPFVDLDCVTEELLGESIADAIRARGESAFREVETRALLGVAEAQRAVVALGGGTLIAPSNRALAKSRGVVVTLRVSEATAARRVRGGADRPLFREGLLQERAVIYAEADCCVDTDARSVDEVVDAILAWLGGRRE
jgi:shikimate kinase